VDFNRPTVGVDELFGDGESQSAVGAFDAGFVSAPEAVENEWQVFRGDAGTRIANGNL
jgi:hypothetical protein